MEGGGNNTASTHLQSAVDRTIQKRDGQISHFVQLLKAETQEEQGIPHLQPIK